MDILVDVNTKTDLKGYQHIRLNMPKPDVLNRAGAQQMYLTVGVRHKARVLSRIWR